MGDFLTFSSIIRPGLNGGHSTFARDPRRDALFMVCNANIRVVSKIAKLKTPSKNPGGNALIRKLEAIDRKLAQIIRLQCLLITVN